MWFRVVAEGVLAVCLCLGCDGVGGICGEWLRGFDQGLEGCDGVMSVSCEFGLFV